MPPHTNVKGGGGHETSLFKVLKASQKLYDIAYMFDRGLMPLKAIKSYINQTFYFD